MMNMITLKSEMPFSYFPWIKKSLFIRISRFEMVGGGND